MLQHSSASDFYDLSTSISSRHTPPYSPTGGTTAISAISGINSNSSINNNNNNSSSNNNHLDATQLGIGGGGVGGSPSGRGGNGDALPSFGFTQEQVACVCEVRQQCHKKEMQQKNIVYFYILGPATSGQHRTTGSLPLVVAAM